MEILKQNANKAYILNVGQEAKDRLDLLDKVYGTHSRNFLKNILKDGMNIATFGCGTGNLELWISQHIGKKGKIIASDISEKQIEIAKIKAENLKIQNIEFVCSCIHEINLPSNFDLTYSRYLLMHLPKPNDAVKKMISLLKQGGSIVLEEITTNSGFSDPKSIFADQALAIMLDIARKKNLDYNIGHKLFGILTKAGMGDVEINSYQPIFSSGEEKFYVNKSVAEAFNTIIESKIITATELNDLLENANQFAKQPNTLIGLPTSYQAHGKKI
ncbi:MAG: methyltransferase domain-containing protein [Gammaproteobacteria bacterium]